MPESGPIIARLPCPVCLGVLMQKVSIPRAEKRGAGALVLDHCTRCGGAWFEEGEIEKVACHRRENIVSRLRAREAPPVPPCHKCHAPLARDAAYCRGCGRPNELPCPSCQSPMHRVECGGLVLDTCDRCRGAWFDHTELEAVWRLSVLDAVVRQDARKATAERKRGSAKRNGTHESITVGDVGGSLIDGIVYAPDLMFHGADAAVDVAASVGHGIVSGAAAEATVAAVEVVADASSGVFEVIAEIIGSIFDGI